MINLLPPNHAAAIRYGRQNTKLLSWLAGAAVAIIVLVLILAGGWFYLNKQSKDLKHNLDSTNQQLTEQNLGKVESDAKEITGDINVIDKVLSQEIHFSDLIQAIGSYMPPGTVLSSLTLSNEVTGGLDLSVNAKDYASAAQVAVNLNDPKDNLFSKVDIVNINCGNAGNKQYSCSTVLRVLFSKSAQTRFLNAGSKT
jgi:Tfp pilus assembly protein PilN